MNHSLFTEYNSKLAALLHGDPNEIHRKNKYGKIIAPGMMRLQGFLAINKWQPGYSLEVFLEKTLEVPNENLEYRIKVDNPRKYTLQENDVIYFSAVINPITKEKTLEKPFLKNVYSYEISYEDIPIEKIENWRFYKKVPIRLVSQIIPETDSLTLERIAAVGVSINAVLKFFVDNKEYFPELYFTEIRENGKEIILEHRLVLHMLKETDSIKQIEIEIRPPKNNYRSKREFIITINEISGLFTLDIYATKMSLKLLSRMLKKSKKPFSLFVGFPEKSFRRFLRPRKS